MVQVDEVATPHAVAVSQRTGVQGRVAAWARRRRWEMVLEQFPDLAAMKVLDLGSTTSTWLRAPVRPALVVAVNLVPLSDFGEHWINPVRGDATDRSTWGRWEHEDFDLVFSNSLIEHLGGHTQRQRFAEVVRGAAPGTWIQTPNRYFPMEPHWVFPGFQFLPARARAAISPRWPLGYPGRSPEDAREQVLSVELLDSFALAAYFPDGEIVRERIAGFTKSLIAVRA